MNNTKSCEVVQSIGNCPASNSIWWYRNVSELRNIKLIRKSWILAWKGLEFCTNRPPVTHFTLAWERVAMVAFTFKNAHFTTCVYDCMGVKSLKNCIKWQKFYCLMNVPLLYSSKAMRNSSFVFITIGPYQAIGSPIGFPDISRNLT